MVQIIEIGQSAMCYIKDTNTGKICLCGLVLV